MSAENEDNEVTQAPAELMPKPLLVVPELKRRRRRYKAKDVERALQDIANQVEDFERIQTERLMGNLASLVVNTQKDAERTTARAAAEAAEILANAKTEADAMITAAREEMRVVSDRLAQIRKLANELINFEPDAQW